MSLEHVDALQCYIFKTLSSVGDKYKEYTPLVFSYPLSKLQDDKDEMMHNDLPLSKWLVPNFC